MCPVLSFTPDTREAIAWFQRTHQVEAVGLGGAVWRLAHMPQPGGLGAQEAWLMDALAHCRMVSDSLLRERRDRLSDEDELKQVHEEFRSQRTH